MRNRGSVLLHVMVTGALIALISATLLRMAMLRYQMGGRGAIILQEKRDDQQVLAAILAAWNNANGGAGQTCANVAIAGYAWAGTAGACNCSYTPAPQTAPPTKPTFTTNGGTPDSCALTIVSALRQ